MLDNSADKDFTRRDGVLSYITDTLLDEVTRTYLNRKKLDPYAVVFVKVDDRIVPMTIGAQGRSPADVKRAARNLAAKKPAVAVLFVHVGEFAAKRNLAIDIEMAVIQLEHPEGDAIWYAPAGSSKLGAWTSCAVADAEYNFPRTALLPQSWMN